MADNLHDTVFLTAGQVLARLPDDDLIECAWFTPQGNYIKSVEVERVAMAEIVALARVAATHPWWLERGFGLVMLNRTCAGFVLLRTETEGPDWTPKTAEVYPSPLTAGWAR